MRLKKLKEKKNQITQRRSKWAAGMGGSMRLCLHKKVEARMFASPDPHT